MTATALRMQFRKLKPRVSFYRDYKKFLNGTFINSLKVKFDTQSISPNENGFLYFSKIFTETLNKHASRKQEKIRGNQSSFINKEISKAITKRTKLRNKFLKHENEIEMKEIEKELLQQS